MKMLNLDNTDTIKVIEINGVEKRKLDKSKILAFSPAGQDMTMVIYGSKENPDSFIIQENVSNFQRALNNILPLGTLEKLLSELRGKAGFSDLSLEQRMDQQAELRREFREQSTAFMQENQDKFWFMMDHQGNYKNIAADEVYEVSPNPQSPWAQMP